MAERGTPGRVSDAIWWQVPPLSSVGDPRHLTHAPAVLSTVGGTPAVWSGDEHAFTGVEEHRAGGDDAAATPSCPRTAGRSSPADPCDRIGTPVRPVPGPRGRTMGGEERGAGGGTVAVELTELHEDYVWRVNRAVAEDRMDVVRELYEEYFEAALERILATA